MISALSEPVASGDYSVLSSGPIEKRILDTLRKTWRRIAHGPIDINERNRLFVDFGIAVLVFGVLYKFILFYQVLSSPFPPLGIDAARFESAWHRFSLVRYLGSEMGFAFFAAIGVFAIGVMFRGGQGGAATRIQAWALYGLMLFLGIVYCLHYRLIFSMNVGLTYDLLLANASAIHASDISENLTVHDIVLFAIAPLGVLWAIHRATAAKAEAVYKLVAACVVLTILAIPLLKDRLKKPVMTSNPISYVLVEMVKTRTWTADGHIEPSPRQMETVGFVDTVFATNPYDDSAVTPISRNEGKQWNIVLLVLESAGQEYLVEEDGVPHPMPFLRELASKSWSFENHYSTANSSHRAVFSLMSGLYAMPSRSPFSLRGDLFVPALNTMLDDSYQSFVVTSASEGSFFPCDSCRTTVSTISRDSVR